MIKKTGLILFCSTICFAEPSQYFGKFKSRNPIEGARRLMAAAYQSCDVLSQKAYQPSVDGGVIGSKSGMILKFSSKSSVLKSHYYLKGKTFSDPNFLPTVYGFGSKISFSGFGDNSQLLSLDDSTKGNCYTGDEKLSWSQAESYNGISCQSTPIQSIDCSGFVTAAFARSGLLLSRYMSSDSNNYLVASNFFLEKIEDEAACFQTVQATNSNNSINPGDVVMWSTHILMIDRVGKDPFGCKSGHWNFDVIQSSGHGMIGINRMRGQDVLGLLPDFVRWAKASCNSSEAHPISFENPGKVRVVRHKGYAMDGCQIEDIQYNEHSERAEIPYIPEVKFSGEENVSSCTNFYPKN